MYYVVGASLGHAFALGKEIPGVPEGNAPTRRPAFGARGPLRVPRPPFSQEPVPTLVGAGFREHVDGSRHYGGGRTASVSRVRNRSILFGPACSRAAVSYLDGRTDMIEETIRGLLRGCELTERSEQ